jgi:hypothetical protein
MRKENEIVAPSGFWKAVNEVRYPVVAGEEPLGTFGGGELVALHVLEVCAGLVVGPHAKCCGEYASGLVSRRARGMSNTLGNAPSDSADACSRASRTRHSHRISSSTMMTAI